MPQQVLGRPCGTSSSAATLEASRHPNNGKGRRDSSGLALRVRGYSSELNAAAQEVRIANRIAVALNWIQINGFPPEPHSTGSRACSGRRLACRRGRHLAARVRYWTLWANLRITEAIRRAGRPALRQARRLPLQVEGVSPEESRHPNNGKGRGDSSGLALLIRGYWSELNAAAQEVRVTNRIAVALKQLDPNQWIPPGTAQHGFPGL